MSFEMSRRQYAELNGPTTGDGIRLADTELIAVVEKDLTQYGDEVSFGGAKSYPRRHGSKLARRGRSGPGPGYHEHHYRGLHRYLLC
ncbi:Urease alpha subunit [Corynebacterium pseudotuberculosis]|nr:Urease alpha subunit [Corynebacterium pseudotuberculosis]